VIEAWSKKDGGDKWGSLLSSQKRTLEKVTYQFTKHYFSGIQEWNFVLQADKVTQRDGSHSTNTTFSNAWYYRPISANNSVIELPAGQKITTEEIKKEPVQQTAANNEAILGTWGIGTTIASSYNMHINEGSIIKQYTFHTNGTYSFYIKTFRYQLDKLLLTRETGTYQLSGNNLTINPQKSVIEAWSKKDGTDNWGKLLSSQKKDLEKTTYRFTKHYSEVLEEWRIVLQANKETKRDGYYNGGTAFSNAWIYSPVTCKDCFIKLPD
jgi:starvation-inducible outer membrane lipoprotein